jgi:uncharacterized protein (DUF2147 family)
MNRCTGQLIWRLFGIAAAVTAMWSLPARSADNLDGFWMDSDGEVILEVSRCGDARCAKVAWLKKPLGPDGLPLTDYRNSDPKLRSRPVCGLRVVSGFKQQADGTWAEGSVYVSDLGATFSGYAEVLSANKVKITGYVLLPLFGQSEIWTRVTTPFEHCEKKQEKAAQSQGSAKAKTAPTPDSMAKEVPAGTASAE